MQDYYESLIRSHICAFDWYKNRRLWMCFYLFIFCTRTVYSEYILLPWRFKDAREVYPSRKYELFFWDNKATLAIKDTEPNDTGRYRCEVMNRLGRVESTGSLHVYSMPSLLFPSYHLGGFIYAFINTRSGVITLGGKSTQRWIKICLVVVATPIFVKLEAKVKKNNWVN